MGFDEVGQVVDGGVDDAPEGVLGGVFADLSPSECLARSHGVGLCFHQLIRENE